MATSVKQLGKQIENAYDVWSGKVSLIYSIKAIIDNTEYYTNLNDYNRHNASEYARTNMKEKARFNKIGNDFAVAVNHAKQLRQKLMEEEKQAYQKFKELDAKYVAITGHRYEGVL